MESLPGVATKPRILEWYNRHQILEIYSQGGSIDHLANFLIFIIVLVFYFFNS